MTITPSFAKHEKLSLKRHPTLNERWVQERIEEDPSILGLDGELRLLDRERPLAAGGRLDLLLLDDDNNRRFEVELQLGATDPSHIIRCIEYWDLERRRYPGYEHVAVIVAEDVTTRFLNVMSLLSGSIPIIAIQLDALQLDDRLILNFVKVLDQTELRTDDTEEDSGGGEVDRTYWESKAGASLMQLVDTVLESINGAGSRTHELNYLRQYIGLKSGGVVNNFVHMHPKPQKKYTHITMRLSTSPEWVERLEEAGLHVRSKRKGKLRLSIKPEEFEPHANLVREILAECVREFEG